MLPFCSRKPALIALVAVVTLVVAACSKPSAPVELPAERLIGEIVFPVPTATYDPIRYEAGVLIAAAWEQLGLKVKLEPMEFTALSQRGQNEPWDWDAVIMGYVSRPERLDPDVLLYRPFHSSGVRHEGPNYSGYSSLEFDQAVEAQRVEMDADKRKELVFRCQEILAEDMPAVALYHVAEVHVYNNQTFTDFVPMTGQGNWNIWSLLSARPLTTQRYLRIGQVWDIDSTNPYAATGGGNIETMRMIYDMLARVGPDGEVRPWAAERWTVVDPTTIDVKLRSGMKFHDGKPVTAYDVKFSYDFVKEWKVPILLPFVDPIESIEALDDLNLRFRLTAPYPGLFQVTFGQVYIVPRHIWEGVCEREKVSRPDEWKNPNPVGSGPYRFAHWRVGEEVKLNRSADHFQPPSADGLIQVVFANPDAIFLALKKGEIDMHDRRLLPVHIEEAETVPHLTKVIKPDFGVYYAAFNLRRPPFDDKAFRQALCHAIDCDTFVDTLLQGYGEPGRGFIAPANKRWHNPNQKAYAFDLDKARALLKQAGYEWGADGRLYYPGR